MSSTTSSEASGSRKSSYLECYKVLYRLGELHKPGSRTWQEGLLSYYTSNRKLVLLDNRGNTLEESFDTRPPSTEVGDQQPKLVKEEGIRTATYPNEVPFQIGEHYTVEIERLRFIQERTHHEELMRESLHKNKQSRLKRKREFFKDVPDILTAALPPSDRSCSSSNLESDDTGSLVGRNISTELFDSTPYRSRLKMHTFKSPLKIASNPSTPKSLSKKGPIQSPPKDSPLKSLFKTPSRYRAVGLSKHPKRDR